MTRAKEAWMATVGAVVLMGAVGCSPPGMGSYSVPVSLSESLQPAGPLEVDVIGVGEAGVDSIEDYPLDEYFQASNAFRQNLKRRVTMVFGPDQPRTQTLDLTAGSERYRQWKAEGVMYLVVLADLEPRAGEGRRLVLPLARDRWEGRRIEIVVDPSRVSSVPRPKPDER